ncbi:epidermal growth factor receptor substrate 15-like 1 isoform X1 [Poecilia formosa]|uniref:epidermal growth factor receptor substrate 15-like 1 isoform X1 n=2 Tax=Poecilia formosa TaxID=48698 RepID=UPI0007BA56FB|nr:PREDICTED: epidermal growth factor receptor substrate 15-like 1 isoform X1 [Poecilia formosa]
MSKGIEQFSSTLNGTNGGSMTNLADMSESFNDKESGGFSAAGKGRQEDIFKVKSSVFYNQPQDLQSDLFNSEDPFKTDPFKGDPFESDPFGKAPSTSIDPFEGDPFKEADPFKASSEDFFKKTTKMDHFSTTDPLCKSATLPSKQTSHFAGSDPFSTNHQKPRGSDLFSTLDPFGSSTFNSATNSCTGFADFSHMSKARDPFEGRANWLPDYQKLVTSYSDDNTTGQQPMEMKCGSQKEPGGMKAAKRVAS